MQPGTFRLSLILTLAFGCTRNTIGEDGGSGGEGTATSSAGSGGSATSGPTTAVDMTSAGTMDATGATGEPSCDVLAWDEPGPEVEVRIRNQRSTPVFLVADECASFTVTGPGSSETLKQQPVAAGAGVPWCTDRSGDLCNGQGCEQTATQGFTIMPSGTLTLQWPGVHYVAIPTPQSCDACSDERCIDRVSASPGAHEFGVVGGTTCESPSCDCPAGQESCVTFWGFSGPMVELQEAVEYPGGAPAGVDLVF